MVEEDRLKEWVEQKLRDGVSEDRIRRSLENAGHDPSLVDRADNPFEEDESSPEIEGSEDQPFTSADGGSGDDRSSSGEEPGRPRESGEGPSTPGAPVAEDIGEQKKQEMESGHGFPDLDLEELPLKPALAVLGFLLVGGLVFALYSSGTLPDASDVQVPSAGGGGGETMDVSDAEQNCDVGVRIRSAESSGGTTTAQLRVYRGETPAYFRLHDGETLVAEEQFVISDTRTVTVNATGDLASFGPIGCSFEDEYRVR